jgi:hypothetical protein
LCLEKYFLEESLEDVLFEVFETSVVRSCSMGAESRDR